MTVDLNGRVAVVTGAASGIGRATTLLLAQCGARVFAGDFRPQPANHEAFQRLGVIELHCDVRHGDQVAALVNRAARDGGGLHIVVSNAGINCGGLLTSLSETAWDDCLDTNLKGAFLVCKHAIPHLQAAGGGAVVFTSSNAGLLPRAHDPVYGTSKAALIALAANLALCHALDRIRFNCVCPGPVERTALIDDVLAASADRAQAEREFVAASPLADAYGRMISPEEVARAILYLVSDAAVMVTGTAVRIDGGKSLGVPPRRA
jgi:NAD(P)-dependent dehydrogenase (short-subunit alcohol dehydrogenase family)